ncbi:MAG: glycan-binding surface protein [Bacteroidia bacterium]|nr:glycan-binding surface protein [Bacteroidia bacterium]
MNNILKFGRTLALASAAVFAFVACEDEPDKYEVAGGSPEVIYVVKPTNPDSLIFSAFMGERVVLMGNNLRSVTKLCFNDREAILNTSLITDHTLFVTVPSTLPDVPTDKIYMTNKNGEVTEFSFGVDVPAPTVSSLKCEQVKPGDVATILGDFLLDYEEAPMTVKMPDGKVISEYVSLSKTEASFKIPEGCTKSGPITVTTKYGSTASKFYFNDDRGILFNFEGELAHESVSIADGKFNHGWHPRIVVNDETSLDGYYLQMGDGSSVLDAEGGWNDGQFCFEYWCGNWDSNFVPDAKLFDVVDFTNYEKMALKFEINVPKSNPWTSGAMQLIFAPAEGENSVTLFAANNTHFNNTVLPRGLYRPWEASGSFDTNGEWQTVTIPFSEFIYGSDGTKASGSLTPTSFASLTIFVWSGGVNGTEGKPIIKLDNIRAVSIK